MKQTWLFSSLQSMFLKKLLLEVGNGGFRNSGFYKIGLSCTVAFFHHERYFK